jgi:pyrrolysine biosynthesis protein PylD
MTRLTSEDIDGISERMLKDFDRDLKLKTGTSLYELFRFLLGISSIQYCDLSDTRISVVPITAGSGIIPGFSERVALILKFIGLNASKTLKTDVEGFYEAFKKGADIIFSADDNVFAAFNLKKKRVVTNSYATGVGYAAILEVALNGLEDKKVVLIGAGKVGVAALQYVVPKRAETIVLENNEEKVRKVKECFPEVQVELIDCEEDIEKLLSEEIDGLFVAAPIKRLNIKKEKLNKIKVAFPAVPFSLPKEYINHRNIIHDPLIIGVVSMAALVLRD